jgi:hypothetical protein
MGYTINLEIKMDEYIMLKEKETDAVYLKETEIENLFRHKGEDPKTEEV